MLYYIFKKVKEAFLTTIVTYVNSKLLEHVIYSHMFQHLKKYVQYDNTYVFKRMWKLCNLHIATVNEMI